VLSYGVACGALAIAGLFAVSNPDSFGHLAQGRQIAELGYIPSHDSLSFWQARPAVWRNYEWLSDLGMWRLYHWGGADALLAFKCLLLGIAAALLVRFAQLRGGIRAAALCAFFILCAIPASRARLTERPHVLALPLAALYLLGLGYLSRGWGKATTGATFAWIVALAGLHVLWVNLHGSHLLGLALTVVHLLCASSQTSSRRALLAVLGLQLVACCVSPYGPYIVIDAVEHVLNPAYRYLITEWQPWQPVDPVWWIVHPILQTLLLASLAVRLARRDAAARSGLAFACLLALASFRSIRFVADYLLLSAPILAAGLASLGGGVPAGKFWPTLAAATGFAAAATAWGSANLPPYEAIGHGANTLKMPAATGQWLAQHARRPRVLAAIEDSWFLMFATPGARFLIDGRIPFYGASHVRRVLAAYDRPDELSALLVHYDIDSVVLRHTYKAHQLALEAMRRRPRWLLASLEDRYALFIRDDLPLLGAERVRPLALQPGYNVDWLLNASPDAESAIRANLARLPDHENTRGYRSWVESMLALEPMLRAGASNGLRAPRNENERQRLRKVLGWLEHSARNAADVPIVHAYHGLVATALCQLETAQTAFDRASNEGESRESLLGVQEVALREGRIDDVAAFLDRAQSVPGATSDAWLLALRQDLALPPRCPVDPGDSSTHR
jgi:hypothetical protein